ncbi:MAG: hypothetical protein ACRD38_09975 [Nitrososphaerales archaeon]
MSKNGELLYARPVLIYDNFCTSCTRFARLSRTLSRNRIYLVGHYTNEGQAIKSKVFPDGFDANRMFWMVTSKGAFGARSGLTPLCSEIIKGLFGVGEKIDARSISNIEQSNLSCNVDSMSCRSMPGFFERLSGLLKNSKKIERT